MGRFGLVQVLAGPLVTQGKLEKTRGQVLMSYAISLQDPQPVAPPFPSSLQPPA